jgi:SanA protein
MIKKIKSLFKNKKFKRFVYATLIILSIFTIWANYSITSFSNKYITSDIRKVKKHRVALLLGTSKYRRNGKKNDYFFHRIKAVKLLYTNNKIEHVLISGDNSSKSYNEPEDMKNELIKVGIPEDKIHLDFAGFSTIESVIRANKVFGLKSFIVVSQKFHNQRAVYLAREYGIKAYGFNAKNVDAYWGIKTKIREVFARNKVFLDLMFGTEPKYLGEKVIIE